MKDKSGRKAETSSIKSAFDELLKDYRIKDKFMEKNLLASWGRLMGKPIAQRTEKLFIKDKKLFVYLSSAPLRSELDHSKSKVIELLNKEFSENVIVDVIFM
ncbi:MAG: DUF721 domain-containing protein [Cyclobacteriaceae bacterium]